MAHYMSSYYAIVKLLIFIGTNHGDDLIAGGNGFGATGTRQADWINDSLDLAKANTTDFGRRCHGICANYPKAVSK